MSFPQLSDEPPVDVESLASPHSVTSSSAFSEVPSFASVPPTDRVLVRQPSDDAIAMPPPAASTLPTNKASKPAWREVYDAVSGKSYYYHRESRATSWKVPDEPFIPDKNKPSSTGAGAAAVEDPEQAAKDAQWKEGFDGTTKRPYYYNKTTGESLWEDPRSSKARTQWSGINPLAQTASTVPDSTPEEPEHHHEPLPIISIIPATPEAPSRSIRNNNNNNNSNNDDVKVASPMALPSLAAHTPGAPSEPAETSDDPNDTLDEPAFEQFDATVHIRSARHLLESPDDDDDLKVPNANLLNRKSIALSRESVALPPGQLPPSLSSSSRLSIPSSSNSGSINRRNTVENSMTYTVVDESEIPYPEESDEDEDSKAYGIREDVPDQSKQIANHKEALHALKLAEEEAQPDEEEELSQLQFAKHRHMWWRRLLRIGPAFDRERLMRWKKSMIKKALLHANRHLDKECVQTFKNIMSYMGDRESGEVKMHHPIKLLRMVLNAPIGLRDEVYLQLAKQTKQNPGEQSTILGWELFTFCLATFPPSKALRRFLTAYFLENADNPPADFQDTVRDSIGKLARWCYEALPKIVRLGQRKESPTALEIESLQKREPLGVKVFLLDGTFKMVSIDSFTLVEEVMADMAKRLNIGYPQIFGLYEVAEGPDRHMQTNERVVDILAKWNRAAHHQPELKERVMHYKIVYKVRLMVKPDYKPIAQDIPVLKMLYIQCINDIASGKFHVPDKYITTLAALQCQEMFKDFVPEVHDHGWISEKLDELLPLGRLQEKKTSKKGQIERAEWEQKICAKYKQLAGFAQDEARINYLDYVRDLPGYGATAAWATQRLFKDYPPRLFVAVTCDNVLLIHPESKKILDKYEYSNIITWGSNDEKLILVVGNVVQQRKIVFHTPEAKPLDLLIHDYVKCKMEHQDVSNPTRSFQ